MLGQQGIKAENPSFRRKRTQNNWKVGSRQRKRKEAGKTIRETGKLPAANEEK
jgi:hypothetical protein